MRSYTQNIAPIEEGLHSIAGESPDEFPSGRESHYMAVIITRHWTFVCITGFGEI